MTKFKRKIEWVWDYYFVYLLYNGNKQMEYFNYMCDKYGEEWCES